MNAINFEEVQKATKEAADNAAKSFGAISKGLQALTVESTDYTKKSYEAGSAAVEKLFAAKTVEKAIEVQTEYAKSAYEGFVAQATKVQELLTDVAKEAYKPYEGVFAKFGVAAK
ncbi:MAG: phasin family protein [Hyphomicrobiaceae bacterium]|nr:phasin family protein [Hyphomicrobiaceae bacterium]